MKKYLLTALLMFFGAFTYAQTTFEGVITFRSYESNSKSAIKWSSGQAFNGARNTQIFVKGVKAARYDESLGIKTIYDPEKEYVTVIFDELKEAVIFDFDSYVSLFSLYAPWNVSCTKEDQADEIEMIHGYPCKKTIFTLDYAVN